MPAKTHGAGNPIIQTDTKHRNKPRHNTGVYLLIVLVI